MPPNRTPSLLNLSSLQTLSLSGPQCSPQELLSLNALPQLQHLSISYDDGVDEEYARKHAAVFGSLRALRTLGIDYRGVEIDIGLEIAAGVAACTSLTSLQLACWHFEDRVDIATMLQPLRQVKSLMVKAFGTTRSVHRPVQGPLASLAGASRSLTALTSLTFFWPMRLRALIEVYSMTQLQQLFLAGSNVHDEGLDVIAHNMPGLRVLGVGNSCITHIEVEKILRNSELLPELQMLVLAINVWHEFEQENVNFVKACRPALVFKVYDEEWDWWIDNYPEIEGATA